MRWIAPISCGSFARALRKTTRAILFEICADVVDLALRQARDATFSAYPPFNNSSDEPKSDYNLRHTDETPIHPRSAVITA